MNNEILIVLGAPNDPSGNLSKIAIDRLDACFNLYEKNKRILCTGGWGQQFNTSEEAHATYAKRYLIEKGVSENDFLELALSSNTVEDAAKVKEIISNLEHPQLTVITSAYHVDRVKLIFRQVLKNYDIHYVGVKSDLPEEQLNILIKHEKKAIQSIRKNGLYY
jgi:uncharacterized SAM-binding protein YcdF (DUF218 family)